MALTIDGPTPEAPAQSDADLVLMGRRADDYVQTLVSAIRSARLNGFFPPERALGNHLSFLGPGGCDDLYDHVRVSRISGLPTAREIFRVKIDRDLAAEFLATAAAARAPEPGSRMARRIAYYSRLATAEVLPLSRMQIALRQHDAARNLALFRVIFDRFDIASCRFVRYTILLGQRDRTWRRGHVIVDEAELAAPTESFRRIVSRFTADEAELALVLLAKLDGIEVEDVRRCRIGPLLMPGARLDPDFAALLDREQTPELGGGPRWILCFPEDRAGIEVARHAARDPFASLFRDAVNAEAQALVDAKAAELGYRVAKSRKFVCPRPLRAALAQLCKERGAPSIVRAARGT